MITHLPSEIGSLQALRVLELTQNSLRELPKEMGKLKFLEELSLTQNQIESLPSGDDNSKDPLLIKPEVLNMIS